MTTSKQLSFNVLVEKIDDAYVAHCLETGLVATSLDRQDVQAKMNKMIVRTVEFALKHNRLSDIFQPAPEEVFKKWREAKCLPSKSANPVTMDHHIGGLVVNQAAYFA
jgi:hypothetical protein